MTDSASIAMVRNGRTFPAICFAMAGALFWSLRIVYWRTIHEEPFSDMADFINVATGVRGHWSFAFDSFWQSYRPPVVPLMMAVTSFYSGSFSLAAWQVSQTLFVFASLLWLARELLLATKNPWPSIALILCVAVTRSSIFWSYKAASESAAEGFVYAVLAIALGCIRTQTPLTAFTAGVICMAASLARSSLAPVIAVVGLVIIGYACMRRLPLKRLALLSTAFALGLGLTWAPWLVRTYHLYGRVVPFTTQGPYTFLWEWGAVKVRSPDGSEVMKTVDDLTREAPERFKTDYQAAQEGQRIAREWLSDNWRLYLRAIPRRLWRQIDERTEYLTKVPRDHLFNVSVEPLLDKRGALVLVGMAGLVLFVIAYGAWALPIAVTPVILWLFGALFLGYPRMFDPYLPLALYGIFLIPLSIHKRAKSRESFFF